MAECAYVYDSLGRVLEEAQSLDSEGSVVTRYATNHAYFSAVISGVTYPNGRQIQNTYDALYRRTAVADTPAPGSSSSSSDSSGGTSGAFVAQWDFFGNRIAETRLGNNITCTFMNNDRTHSAVQSPGTALPGWGDASSDRLGYDGAGRMIAKRYIPSTLNESGGYEDTTPVVGFTTRFDKASNKFFERALHAENRSFLYIPLDEAGNPTGGIDSMNRLLQYQRGNLAPGGPESPAGGSVVTPLTLPGADASRTYDLDHLGNWKKSVYAAIPEPPAPESSSSSYSSISSEEEPTQNIDRRDHNALNQITRRKPANGDAWDVFAYDLNGNLLDDGERVMAYDSLNRLVQVARKSDGAVMGRYLYDAGNRRVQMVVTNGGLSEDIPNGTSQYCYFAGSWQDTEEFYASEASEESPSQYKQFIWGTYIDELIQLTLLQTAGPQELPPGAYYPLQDLLYRTACVANAAEATLSSSSEQEIGQIVEAYDYDVYGNTIIFTAADTGEGWWSKDAPQAMYGTNDVLWCGYRYEPGTWLYAVRFRHYTPTAGRWVQRDFIEESQNLYSYITGKVTRSSIDPTGLFECCAEWKPRYDILGKTVKDCTIDEFNKRNPGIMIALKATGGTLISVMISVITTASDSKKLSYRTGAFVLLFAMYDMYSLMQSFVDSYDWCKEEKCVTFTHKFQVTSKRSWYNPKRWAGFDLCYFEDCPPSSDKVELNSSGEAWRPGT